jgi:DNA-binding helix-hairpin-helix protein with protein kinase domain
VGALLEIKKTLVSCARVSNHVYLKGLERCPWCELESRDVLYFLNSAALLQIGKIGWNQKLSRIQAITLPDDNIAYHNLHTIQVIPNPWPGRKKLNMIFFYRYIILLGLFLIGFLRPSIAPALGAVAVIVWFTLGATTVEERKKEVIRRKDAVRIAMENYGGLIKDVRHERNKFDITKKNFSSLCQKYQKVASDMATVEYLIKQDLAANRVSVTRTAARSKIAAQQRSIETQINDCETELEQIRKLVIAKTFSLERALEAWAQALADNKAV